MEDSNTDRKAKAPFSGLGVLEVAILFIKPGLSADFEKAFSEAQKVISSTDGYISHQLKKCLEETDKYILLVNWQTLEAHTEGFRGSAAYQDWKKLLHHFYEPFPVVEHYAEVNQS
ncbi:antibiotic biosynthesis monooxygenase family protein [Pedobacter jamesrossensis]|uniref:Antibiotic biosynthesis monooxygenase family protein n=1 Tax=Pedobacter jamesrossensis TaxID=1908238 RepID=A0ABV8NKD5_9SPHI